MNEKVTLFLELNEPYAAGFFEEEDKGLFVRFSRAQRRYFENKPVDDYIGKRLYPSGVIHNGGYAVHPDCAKTFNPDYYIPLYEKSPEAAKLMKEVRDKSNFTVCTSQQKLDTKIVFLGIQYADIILLHMLPCTAWVLDIPANMQVVPR